MCIVPETISFFYLIVGIIQLPIQYINDMALWPRKQYVYWHKTDLIKYIYVNK